MISNAQVRLLHFGLRDRFCWALNVSFREVRLNISHLQRMSAVRPKLPFAVSAWEQFLKM